jgi:anaerobic selenocysteine-containing dehydrogenase
MRRPGLRTIFGRGLMEGTTIHSTCGYCSTGCNLIVQMAGGRPVKVNADPDYPVNRGKACPKGFQFLGHLGSADRALQPYLRDDHGQLRPIDWYKALGLFTDGFKRIQSRYGDESVAFIGTGQLTTEELAYLGALAKFGMGFVHGDGNTRQCMATAAVAYKQSFGFDAPPFTYDDFEQSDVLVFVGSNPAIAHPIMWQRVKRNARQPKVVVIDPRSTQTAAGAEHYAILPKSDLWLLYGLARVLISRGWIDQAYVERHTSGFEQFKAHVGDFDLDRVSKTTGLGARRVEELAETIHGGARVSFWWTMGVNQSYQAVRTAQAIIDLALLTGNMGRPGTGANSITGQCNAMGSRMFSNTASLFCGRDFTDPAHRADVASILGMDVGRVPSRPSLAYDQILEGVDSGQIKGLWIICTNPAHSWPDQNDLKRVLRKAEFVVVQDMFHGTETAHFAHLVLPAAGCGEKDGTFINSERRVGVVHKVLDPPGEALPDLEIFQRIAGRWGCSDLLREWTSPEAVFQIMKKLSRGRPCDISGIEDYAMIQERGGIQWPCPADDPPTGQERRLFEAGGFFHEDGRARFIFEDVAGPPEMPDADYPLVLLTGRGSVAQWHTLTRTDRAPLLKRASPDPDYVEMSRQDAEESGIAAEEWVEVSSRRGKVKAKAKVVEGIRQGQVFMPMHFPATNSLTLASFDPYSRQPSYKHGAVMTRPAG